MDPMQLYLDLWHRGIRLAVVGDGNLAVEWQGEVLTPQLEDAVRANRDGLIAIARERMAPARECFCGHNEWHEYAPGQYVCRTCYPSYEDLTWQDWAAFPTEPIRVVDPGPTGMDRSDHPPPLLKYHDGDCAALVGGPCECIPTVAPAPPAQSQEWVAMVNAVVDAQDRGDLSEAARRYGEAMVWAEANRYDPFEGVE